MAKIVLRARNHKYIEDMENKCKLFLQNCEKFSWFIIRYFGKEYYNELVALANNDEDVELNNRLNDVWFRLPDHIFNIRENPEGWAEFLQCIEE